MKTKRWYQTEPRHWLLGDSVFDFYRWIAIQRPWLIGESDEA